MLRTFFVLLLAFLAAGPVSAQDGIKEGEALLEIGRRHDAYFAFKAVLDSDPDNSLAHYRLGELYLVEEDYQRAANELMECVNGDQEPKWTVVWAHINRGKIFDLVGQRARAIHSYELAVRTRDDTQNAQAVAKRHLKDPFRRP